MVDFSHLSLVPPSSTPRVPSTSLLYPQTSASPSTITMTLDYLQVTPKFTCDLTPSEINELVSLLLKLAIRSEGGKSTTTTTPTLSYPQPQAGAIAASLSRALLSASAAGPQATTHNLNTFPTSPPVVPASCSSCSSLLLFEQETHPAIGLLNITIPPPDFSGLFNLVTISDFETLFNFLVILCLLYLLCIPPVSGLPSSSSSFLTSLR